VRLARETGDPEFEESLRASIMFAYYSAGRLREGLEYAEKLQARLSAARGADAAAHVSSDFVSLGFRAMMASLMGRPREAARDLERAIQVGSEQGKRFSWMHGSLVDVAHFTGDTSGALAHARAAVQSAEEYGSTFFTAVAYRALGAAQLLGSRWEEASEALERALRIVRGSRTAMYQEGAILALLAQAELGGGANERASGLALQAVEAAARTHARIAECVAQLTLARALATTRGAGGAGEIDRALRRLAELVDETGARSYAPFLHVERAELARLRGDDSARRAELEEARSLFAEMGATPHADRLAGELS
jgi:tetratricopeptide (TPR) repeat protein